MAEIRFNYGDKFTQTSDSNTGIGSTIPAGKLDVAGGTSAGSLRVSGIASLSSYQGFVNTKLSTTEDLIVEAGQSGSVSGEVVIGTGQTISVSTGATTGQGGIQSLKVYETFMPPVGGTADRPTDVKPGMVYYNKDFKTIEFWDGNFWKQVDNTTRSCRGVFGGGYDTAQPANVTSVEFVNIASRGNGQNFGDLIAISYSQAGSASEIRGIISGKAGYSDDIEYITIASRGNGIDFGNMSASRGSHTAACNSSTRSIFSGGYVSPGVSSNILDYVEIMTLGNALDFGDLVEPRYGLTSFSSPVRGVCAGGRNHPAGDSPLGTRMIDFFIIASKGNATDFGDLVAKHSYMSSTGNSIRGVIGAGTNGPSSLLSFITIASEGNSIFFGDLSYSGAGVNQGNCSSSTRGLFAGGGSPARVNTIDEISIQSAGNATDFGDLSVKRGFPFGLSDSNGGLGGF